jgi:SAGA-associated factor 73
MRSISDLQESLYGCEESCSWSITTLRHAPHRIPEKEPSQATKCEPLTFSTSATDNGTEAAIDANAPLEDEEAANGPVDSDEELTSVMHGLSNWNPQPVVPPLVHVPIEKQYMRQRLYDQLHNATNGFTVNIFKVVGYGAQKLPPGHPGHDGLEEGDADGEMDGGMSATGLGIGMAGVAARRASGFNMQLPPQRRTSSTSRPTA